MAGENSICIKLHLFSQFLIKYLDCSFKKKRFKYFSVPKERLTGEPLISRPNELTTQSAVQP